MVFEPCKLPWCKGQVLPRSAILCSMAKPGVVVGEVLYGDYNGHLHPLNFMYFSLDSRCLVADHPESVQHEVESHFCPNCNSLCTTPEAHVNDNRFSYALV